MKYVMFKVGDQYVPFLFPESLVHAQVAERLGTLVSLQRATVVSAGEISIITAGVYGGSTTLELEADEADRQRINCMDYSGGQDLPNNPRTELLVLEAMRKALGDT